MGMQTSTAGRSALIQREGCSLAAYLDSVGVPTIGVGHTGRASPPPVALGMTITHAQADEIFASDLQPFEDAINAAIKVVVRQGQFDALVSLAFNIGAHGFTGSTVVHRLNAGDIAGAADAFLMWEKPTELRRRRIAERAQFLADTSAMTTGLIKAQPVVTKALTPPPRPLPPDGPRIDPKPPAPGPWGWIKSLFARRA